MVFLYKPSIYAGFRGRIFLFSFGLFLRKSLKRLAEKIKTDLFEPPSTNVNAFSVEATS